MEEIKVLGVDPSVRFTGLAIVTYDCVYKKYSVTGGELLINPRIKSNENDSFTTKQINTTQNMIVEITDAAKRKEYKDCDFNVIESSSFCFNKFISTFTIASISHISGAAFAAFDSERSMLVPPNIWKEKKKKEMSCAETQETLGPWHAWPLFSKIKTEANAEHVIDAAGLALWYLKNFVVNT